MFIAYNATGNIVFSKHLNTQELMKYYCPACGGRVVFRKGSKMIPHFAHKQRAKCDGYSEPESKEHMQGKLDLFKTLQKRTSICYLEKYFAEIKQRTDIFIKHNNNYYALEFQCSILSIETLIARTNGYNELNIQVVWIFNQELLQKYTAYKWKLKAFVQQSMIIAPTIFTYNPDEKILMRLSQVTPFSKTNFFTNIKTIPLKRLTPEFFSGSNNSKPQFFANWVQHRNFCCKKPIYNYNLRTSFYKKMYALNLALASLPLFIGIPLPASWIIITPVIEWQGQIYLYLLNVYRRHKGCAIISEYRLWCMLRYLYQKGDIVIRKEVKHGQKVLVNLLTEFINVLIFVKFLVKGEQKNSYYINGDTIDAEKEENIYQYLITLFAENNILYNVK